MPHWSESEREYSEYLQTEEWRKRRAACLKAAGYRCMVCSSKKNLQAHHRTYERLGSELPEDLTCLCDRCHRAFSYQWPELKPELRPPSEAAERAKANRWAKLGCLGLAMLAAIVIWLVSR